MISSRRDASARAPFFVSSPTASGVQLPFETNSTWNFSTSVLSFWVKKDRTRLSHTRDRRLASEIPLSTFVAVDGLTSFGCARRRCSKALRKQPIRGIESSASKRTSYNPWLHRHFHDFVFSRPGAGLAKLRHRTLLGKLPEIGDISSKGAPKVWKIYSGTCNKKENRSTLKEKKRRAS